MGGLRPRGLREPPYPPSQPTGHSAHFRTGQNHNRASLTPGVRNLTFLMST